LSRGEQIPASIRGGIEFFSPHARPGAPPGRANSLRAAEVECVGEDKACKALWP
jgi:hypothetical protein